MILYLFVKAGYDRVEPYFAHLCNSYSWKQMIIPVMCNEIRIRSRGRRKMAFQSVQFQKFSGGPSPPWPPPPPHEVISFGTHVRAFGAHICLFYLWLWYFKMLPKTW